MEKCAYYLDRRGNRDFKLKTAGLNTNRRGESVAQRESTVVEPHEFVFEVTFGLRLVRQVSYHSSPFLPPPDSPTRFIKSMRGRNIAMTMLPTITARQTIIIGSRSEVMAATALSTSSS